MLIRITLLFTLLCGLFFFLNANSIAYAAGDLEHLSCSGSIIQGNDGYQLEPDAGAEPWCSSGLPQRLLQKVLRTCAVGSRCHIEGSVRGHGLFEWYRIRSVTR